MAQEILPVLGKKVHGGGGFEDKLGIWGGAVFAIRCLLQEAGIRQPLHLPERLGGGDVQFLCDFVQLESLRLKLLNYPAPVGA